MPNRIWMATICLHISAVLYVLVGLLGAAVVQHESKVGAAIVFGFIAAFAVPVEVVAAGIKKHKFWAWIVGLVIFGLYIPSAFLPLGAFGMWGLLDAGSREAFGVGPQPQRRKE